MIPEKVRSHFPAFMVQVLATSVGLLLALGLDQWRDRRRQADLASAHLGAIQAELRSNDHELVLELKSFERTDQILAEVLLALERGQKLDTSRPLSLSIASLRQASWDMAVAGQTPLRANLERMARLATAYEGLRMLRGMQDQVLTDTETLEFLAVLLQEGRQPAHLSRKEILARVRGLRSKLALLRATAPSVRADIAKALAP